MQGALGKFKTIAIGAFAAFATSEVLGKFVEETKESQAALAQLGVAFQNSAESAKRSKQDILEFSAAAQKMTAFSDESVTRAQTALLRFGRVSGDVFDRARKDILDVSAALGIDLETAAFSVGRALEAPAQGLRQLRSLGVVFSDSQQKLIKNLEDTGQIAKADAIILDALEAHFSGAAHAAENTLGGALDRLKNTFNDLFEVADGSASAVTGGINSLSDALANPEIKKNIDFLVGGLVGWGAAFLHDVSLAVEGLKFIASFAVHEAPTAHDALLEKQSNLGQSINQALESLATAKQGGDRVALNSAQQLLDRARAALKDVEQQLRSNAQGAGKPQGIGSRQVTKPGGVTFVSDEENKQAADDRAAAALASLQEIHVAIGPSKLELQGVNKLLQQFDDDTKTAGETASSSFELAKAKLNELNLSAEEYKKRIDAIIDAQFGTDAERELALQAINAKKILIEPLTNQQQAIKDAIDTVKEGLSNLAQSGQFTGRAILHYLLAAFTSKAIFQAIDSIGAALTKALTKSSGTGGLAGALGGILGGLVGAGKIGGTGYGGNNLPSGGPVYAAGGGAATNRARIVGEDGPELELNGGGQVFNRRQMQFAGGGGANVTIGDTTIVVQGTGDPERTAQYVEARIDQKQRKFAEQINRTFKDNGFGNLR